MSAAKEKSTKKRKKKLIIISLILVIAVILYAWGFSLKTEKYSIETEKLDKGLTIAFISDLHNCFYGDTEQSALIDAVAESHPDLVVFGGDIIDQYGGTDNALHLASKLSKEYICFYAPGNHELLRDDLEEFERKLFGMGIHVLDDDIYETTIDGQSVTFYGLIDSFQWGESKPLIEEYIEVINEDSYNILIAHQPEQINAYLGVDSDSQRQVSEGTFDLILSGHAHGGQWRIPGILEQGLLAPDQGLFPDYTNGMYTYGDTVHIISRGLARPLRMIVIPRVFNRPELSIIEIMGV